MGDESSNRYTILSSILGIALAAALIFGLLQFRKSGSLFAEKSTQEMTIDSLNTVRNGLSTNVAELGDSLTSRNEAYEKLKVAYERNLSLLDQQNKLASKYRGNYSALKEVNNGNSQRIASLSSEIADLKTMKSAIEEQLKQLPLLQTTIEAGREEQAELEANYAQLTSELTALNERYENLIYDAPADNFEVQVRKGNSQLTAKAKKGKSIKISFRVPEYLKTATPTNSQVYISIFTSDNELLPGLTEEVNATNMRGAVTKYKAHAKQLIDLAKSPQIVEFDIPVVDKLLPGTYTAKIYSATNYLGTTEFQLRDSFLFF